MTTTLASGTPGAWQTASMQGRRGWTYEEIADEYGVTAATVKKTWTKNDLWPEPIGKRGRYREFDPDAIARVAADEQKPKPVEGDPEDLLTVAEIPYAWSPPLAETTVRHYKSTGKLGEPDQSANGVDLYRRSTVLSRLARTRRPRRPRK